jgi:stage V sporulation protein B
MSKAVDVAKTSVKGGFHLLWGLIISTIISAVGTIIVALLLGEDNYGLYSIALTAPTLIILFRDWGINFAMIRYTAQSKAENKNAEIRRIFVSGLTFEIVLGITLSLLGFLTSDFLAVDVFKRPTISPLIQIASFTVLTNALVSTATAAFTGIEKMHLNSIMLVSQSIFKTGLILTLVLLGLGTLGAITGFTISSLLAGLIGVLLMWTVYKKLPDLKGSKMNIGGNIKPMIKYGLPLSLGTILTGFLMQYYSFLLAIFVTDNALIGNYAVAQSFVVLITFFATPVTTMMFPAFSKIDSKNDPETLRNVYQFSVKYSALLVVPATAMIIALAQPAISTLFLNRYTEAPLFLALLAIAYLYSAFGFLSTNNLINGQGETTFSLKLSVLTAAIAIPTGFILIYSFGIFGLIATTLTAAVPSIIIGLQFIKKRYDITLDWKASTKILLSSALAAIITYAFVTEFNSLANLVRLLIGTAIYTVVYIIAAILTRTIDRADINNFRNILTAVGPLTKLFNYLLNILEKITRLLQP